MGGGDWSARSPMIASADAKFLLRSDFPETGPP